LTLAFGVRDFAPGFAPCGSTLAAGAWSPGCASGFDAAGDICAATGSAIIVASAAIFNLMQFSCSVREFGSYRAI
jgi:hypothetical protein